MEGCRRAPDADGWTIMLTGNTRRARQLRRAMSLPEVLLWQALRARPHGAKFRRQQAAGAYVLDFYSSAARLCVEVDGASAHAGQYAADRDARRDRWLAERGIETCRVSAAAVLHDAREVAEGVARLALERAVAGGRQGADGEAPPPASPVPLPVPGRI